MKHAFRKTILWDLLFLTILIAVSLFLISFYFDAQYLNPGYPDWLVHAFRAKFIQEHGFSSWTHYWSNGISIFKSYQFIPHYLTILTTKLAQTDIARAMVLLTILQFVLLRVFVYIVLRLLKFSPITGFICALLSFDIAQYWGGVNDFSLMFASTLFPIMVYLWVKFFNGTYLYLFPYLVGAAFYIHPMLAFYSFGLWVTGIVFSERRILTRSTFIQFGIFLVASSLFWVPLVFKTSYSYSASTYANTFFLNVAVSSFSYIGLSLYIFTCYGLTIVRAFMPIPSKHKWAASLIGYVTIALVLVVVGLNLPLPRAIAQFQYTRGITLIGIAIIISFATVVESALKIKVIVLKGFLMFLFCLSLIEGMWFISIYSASPYNQIDEPVSHYINKNRKNLSDARVWSSDIGPVSYFPPTTVRLPYSYMYHLETNQISSRINALINYHPYIEEIPQSSISRIGDYFKITGTKYVFFDETSPFTQSLLDARDSDYNNTATLAMSRSIYRLFEVPWEIRDSILVDNKYKTAFAHFPFTLELGAVNDQIELDDYVHRFVDVLYKPENTPLTVTYPTQETVQIEVPDDRTSKLVYLNESYDTNWKAYFNNRRQNIEPSGPNYMLITLDNMEKGTLILRHTWPLSFYISVLLIILIPCEMLLMKGITYIYIKKK